MSSNGILRQKLIMGSAHVKNIKYQTHDDSDA